MTGLGWAALSLLGIFLFAALGDLVSEEIRGWLDLAPRAVLRLAATQLEQAQRETIYLEEWLPELIYVLRGAESRPITRLIRGVKFALGLLKSARRIAHLDRAAVQQEVMETLSQIRLRAWLAYRDDPGSVLAYFGDDFRRSDVAELLDSKEVIRERVIRDACLKADPEDVEFIFQLVEPHAETRAWRETLDAADRWDPRALL